MDDRERLIGDSRVYTRFDGFDILKCVCAFLIVCIHCPFEIGWFDGTRNELVIWGGVLHGIS